MSRNSFWFSTQTADSEHIVKRKPESGQQRLSQKNGMMNIRNDLEENEKKIRPDQSQEFLIANKIIVLNILLAPACAVTKYADLQWRHALIESNASIEWHQKDFDELRKRSSQVSKEVDRIAADLDMLREKEVQLLEDIRRCDAEEMSLISDFDKWIVYYNEVAASRMKELQRRVKELRKKRIESMEELAKIRIRICALESKCEMVSYRQGEIMWESKMQGVKKRKWKQ